MLKDLFNYHRTQKEYIILFMFICLSTIFMLNSYNTVIEYKNKIYNKISNEIYNEISKDATWHRPTSCRTKTFKLEDDYNFMKTEKLEKLAKINFVSKY